VIIPSSNTSNRLKRYRFVRLLGEGRYGSVYQAVDEYGRQVAIKRIRLRNLPAKSRKKRLQAFQREAHFLANLKHPHIARYYGCFYYEHDLYLVMQYIEGSTLEQYMEACGGTLQLEEVLDIGIQLCTILEYLHRQDPPVIFRDLKPANVMRTPEGRMILVDFGIARYFRSWQASDTSPLGSMGYAPPEQYLGQTDTRSDLYALGATIYTLLTGEVFAHSFPRLHWSNNLVGDRLGWLLLHLVSYDIRHRHFCATCLKAELQSLACECQQAPHVSVPSAHTFSECSWPGRSHSQTQATTSTSFAASHQKPGIHHAFAPLWRVTWKAALIVSIGLCLSVLVSIIQTALR
jgi:serine/threonine protein kinase